MPSRNGDYAYESEPRSDTTTGEVACPRCGKGTLLKHCAPENACGWWTCDLPCGYRISLFSGTEAVLRRGNPEVSSARVRQDGSRQGPGATPGRGSETDPQTAPAEEEGDDGGYVPRIQA